MKNRTTKILTIILLIIVAAAGFMPFASKEVQAETKTKQIVFDEDTVKGITVKPSKNYTKDGITLDRICEPYQLADGESSYVHFGSGYIYICHGSFTFSSSIGKISKIEIECGSAHNVPSGWTVSDDYSDLTVTWQGDPSYTVMINNEAENRSEITQIENISKMTFTIITEDVTGISLKEDTLEMTVGETKTLTAIFSPSTATEKEVTWSSSNTDVATVDDDGRVTAAAKGEAIITATATNGTEATADDRSATCKVTVKDAEPGVTYYPLWIDGKQLSSEYTGNQQEGWGYEGDDSKGTLKLSNANIKGTSEDGPCINAGSYTQAYSLTIELSGTNYVNLENVSYDGIVVLGNLKITGNGKLVVKGRHDGIMSTQLEIDKTEIDASGENNGVFAGTLFRISDSTLTATGSCAIEPFGHSEIVDSIVTANGSFYGIIVNDKFSSLSISGKSIINATATDDEGHAIAAGYIFLDGVEVTKPEDGRIVTSDSGLGKWTVILDEKDQVARDVTIEPVSPAYSIVSGGNGTYTSGNNKDCVITVKRSINDSLCIDRFKSIEIDGVSLTKDEDYTVKAGSVIITLKAAALNKLSHGDHTVTISFTDGKAETSLTVKKASEPTSVTPFSIPKTGIETPGSDASLRYIILSAICAVTSAMLNKKH